MNTNVMSLPQSHIPTRFRNRRKLYTCLDELFLFLKRWVHSDKLCSQVRLVENAHQYYCENFVHCTIPSSAVLSPEEYAARFDELVSRGHSRLHLNAFGMVDETLIVSVDVPTDSREPHKKVSVHYSGSTKITQRPGVGDRHHIAIV